MNVTRIKTKMTSKLEEKYISIYCQERNNGVAAPLSLGRARLLLQGEVIELMVSNPSKVSEIYTAFENVKEDDTLRERAMIIYDLSTCEEAIKSKYMPFLMQ